MRINIRYLACILLGCVNILIVPQQVMAERMVTDLSRHVIEITSAFSGTQLLIFGAIERNFSQAYGNEALASGDYDIIVVVQSARHDMVIRRKELVGPIWANKKSQMLKNVQGYYAVTTTRPLDLILSHKRLLRLGVGIEQLKVDFKGAVPAEEAKKYREGFIRIMKDKKLYSQQEGTISILDGILFRAILEFPANMPVGEYRVDVHLVRDGMILLSETTPLEVGKKGLERLIYKFAHQQPAYYGLLAVIIALFAGWLGGFLSRKLSG